MKTMRFENYTVEEIKLEQKQTVDGSGLQVAIFPYVEKHDEDSAKVSLTCRIFDQEEEELRNFFLEVRLSGEFKVEDDGEVTDSEITSEALLANNSLSILFPYLRASISQITSIGSNEPVILPPVNILDFVEKNRVNK